MKTALGSTVPVQTSPRAVSVAPKLLSPAQVAKLREEGSTPQCRCGQPLRSDAVRYCLAEHAQPIFAVDLESLARRYNGDLDLVCADLGVSRAELDRQVKADDNLRHALREGMAG
jgi:hypothetical protein